MVNEDDVRAAVCLLVEKFFSLQVELYRQVNTRMKCSFFLVQICNHLLKLQQ